MKRSACELPKPDAQPQAKAMSLTNSPAPKRRSVMYKEKKSRVTIIGLLFGALILLMSAQPAYGQGGTQNVRVVNTTSQPVPTTVQGTVTGDVNVTNTPTVALSPS